MYSFVALTSMLSFCIPGTSKEIKYLSPLSIMSHNGIRVSIDSIPCGIAADLRGFIKGAKKASSMSCLKLSKSSSNGRLTIVSFYSISLFFRDP